MNQKQGSQVLNWVQSEIVAGGGGGGADRDCWRGGCWSRLLTGGGGVNFFAWEIQGVACERVNGLKCVCLTPNAWDLRGLIRRVDHVLFADWLGNFYLMLIRAANPRGHQSANSTWGAPRLPAMHAPPPRLPAMHHPPGCRRCTPPPPPPVAGDAPPPVAGDSLACVAKCFCILVVVPPFEEIETWQLLQVAILSSLRVKYNQALARFFLGGAMFAAVWTKTKQRVCDVMTHLPPPEPISGIVKQAC